MPSILESPTASAYFSRNSLFTAHNGTIVRDTDGCPRTLIVSDMQEKGCTLTNIVFCPVKKTHSRSLVTGIIRYSVFALNPGSSIQLIRKWYHKNEIKLREGKERKFQLCVDEGDDLGVGGRGGEDFQ